MTQPTPNPAHDPQHTTGWLAGAVRLVSSLTILSRLFGLARDVLTARIFGDTALGSAFRAAYAVPNLFRRLFGEGALSAAFLPHYTLLRRDDPLLASKLASIVVRALTLATAALTLLIELALFAFLSTRAPDAELTLSLRLMMLMLPMMPMVCLTAILGGMLQAAGRFAPPAAAPIILNLFQIAAALLFLFKLVGDPTTTAYLVGGAAVLASIAQIAWSLAALRPSVRWTRLTSDAASHARVVLRRFLPACLGLGTLQLNTFLDMTIAMWPTWIGPTMFARPVPLDHSSNSILGFTQTFYQFPLGVFGITVATAVFPLLSRAADRPDDFADVLRRGLRLSLFIALPASIGLVLVRHDLLTIVLSSSRASAPGFSDEGLARAALVLACFAPAVWAYSLNHVLTRAFYARGDTTTPMRVALLMVLVNLSLNLSLIWPLKEAGLALSTACSATIQCATLLALCPRVLGTRPLDSPTLRAALRTLLGSLAMGALVLATRELIPADGHLARALRLGACVLVGAGAYTLLARLLRAPELSWLLAKPPKGADGKTITLPID